MELYFPQYPILRREDIREDIRVDPERELDAFALAELSQLRRGETTYKVLQVDDPQSREAIALKTSYFQLVAFNEDWRFDPQKYQVIFLPRGHPEFKGLKGGMKRIYEFKPEGRESAEQSFSELGAPGGLSPRNRAGFEVVGEGYEEEVVRMDNDEADGIGGKVDRFFRGFLQ